VAVRVRDGKVSTSVKAPLTVPVFLLIFRVAFAGFWPLTKVGIVTRFAAL
jgi:hypothetical protein